VRSTGRVFRDELASSDDRDWKSSSIAIFARFTAAPASRFSSAPSEGSSFMRTVSAPAFRPRSSVRAVSSSAALSAPARRVRARLSSCDTRSRNSESVTRESWKSAPQNTKGGPGRPGVVREPPSCRSRARQAAASAARALAASSANAAASLTAMSDRTFRSISIPASFRPLMNTL
jgi:hypothetical protein